MACQLSRSSVPLLLAATLLASCANKGGPGTLARDWSCKMREMQISPFFPPREDVQVGDVYWLAKVAATDAKSYCAHSPVAGDFLPMPVHLGYLPEVMTLAKTHYEKRPNFPKTTPLAGTVSLGPNGATIAFTPAGTGAIEGVDTLFTTGVSNRTRVVGFPDFMSVKIDRLSLGAIVPIQGMFTPFGLSIDDVEEASISIPVAESYGVPVATAFQGFPADKKASFCAVSKLLAAKTATDPEKGDTTGVAVLVNEVFYTRVIDVSITSKSATAISLARDRQGASSATIPSTTSSGITVPANSASTGLVESNAQLNAVTQGVLKILEARNNVPGVSFAAEQGRSATINMRRIFDRPVAIGYRSVPLAVVDGADGTCTFNVGSFQSGQGPTPAGGGDEGIKVK
ncbi:hypothetical protein [Hydrogenophaga sp.]|uniref:hypothetical protein n=1 Tax=Hydrogenophaga sp. TaxID=1904254 RepID=UPI003F717FF9